MNENENDTQTPEPASHTTALPAEPQADVPRRRSRGLLVGGAVAAALGIGAVGVGLGTGLSALREAAGSNSAGSSSQTQTVPGQILPEQSQGGSGGSQYGTFGGPRFSGTIALNATAATAAQKVGVVTIVSTLNYDASSQAAGSGIVLTSGGKILTNNHVVEGSTAIKVTIESTGASYTAQVVGTDAVDDIAVLQLVDSSGDKVTGLTTATLDNDKVTVGASVTSVGNAEGTGNLVAASGTVTALDQAIQVADDSTGNAEDLSGLIETDADVVSGDSGGPLVDAEGEVTGVVTAASSGSRDVTGYAIPIATAVTIAKKIIAGESGGNIVIGLPAFLGVELASTQSGSGVTVAGTLAGTAADSAGLVAGDTITAVDGSAVTTTDSLSSLIKSHKVGATVTVTYTDESGVSHQVTATLTAGPAA